MASAIVFVIHFEDPYVDVQVVSYQSGQSSLKLLLLVDIVSTDRDRDITVLENTLGSTLGTVN